MSAGMSLGPACDGGGVGATSAMLAYHLTGLSFVLCRKHAHQTVLIKAVAKAHVASQAWQNFTALGGSPQNAPLRSCLGSISFDQPS
jgi:hypothetical protein